MISRFMNKKGIFGWTYLSTNATRICVGRMFGVVMVLYPLFCVGRVLTRGAGVHRLTIQVHLISN